MENKDKVGLVVTIIFVLGMFIFMYKVYSQTAKERKARQEEKAHQEEQRRQGEERINESQIPNDEILRIWKDRRDEGSFGRVMKRVEEMEQFNRTFNRAIRGRL